MALIEKRIGLLFALFLFCLVVTGARAAYLTVLSGSSLKDQAAAQQIALLRQPAPRGAITDRYGRELAVSADAADISVTPYLVKDRAVTARKLAPLLGEPADEIIVKLANEAGFVYLKRGVPGDKASAIAKMDLPGIEQEPVTRRAYPQRMLASQLLGFVGTDGSGLSGVEYSYEKRLHGGDGERRIVRDARGNPISTVPIKRVRPGEDVELSLDTQLQLKTEAVLAEIGAKFRPKGATAIVMDPRTSEVLALANWPRTDANKPGSAPAFASQNRAIGAGYEPGSTFKAITVAGALEDKVVTPSTTFDLPPQLQVADRVIKESHPRGPITLTVAQIIEQSSNVGSVKVGQALGVKRFDKWVRRFGFGSKTNIDLQGEEQGLVLRPEQYSGSTIGNMPIGQGLTVTPMQMAAAYSAIANGGTLRPPRIVRAVGGKPVTGRGGKRIISERTARSLRGMLEKVLGPGGTASEAQIPGYELAGKTGTAQKAGVGGYLKDKFVASFIGFAPSQNPRLLVSVMVDEPKGQYYGGLVAAPAFQKIVSFGLPYLRIPPTE